MAQRRNRNQRRNSPKSRSDRQQRERNREREIARESSQNEGEPRQSSAEQKAVEELLSGIGVPKPTSFVPDDFQIEAREAIENEDVLVTAPTGSGKTWIAREEIRRLLAQGRRAWYTTPLKALTNSKYIEFANEFGSENVGILTGDRKENADAPLIVGTTEIYRNQLFDALRSGTEVGTDFVIIDEAHYLSDDYRGHVWEEAIILTPPWIRMLLLSATVGKADEFADWMEDVRGVKVHVINRAGARPVELRAAYLANNLLLYPLVDEHGKLNRKVEELSRPQRQNYRRRR
ncbi:MAG: DEAD/DEAH box helicase [Pyrinomonadaceae bacterium]